MSDLQTRLDRIAGREPAPDPLADPTRRLLKLLWRNLAISAIIVGAGFAFLITCVLLCPEMPPPA